MTTYKFKPHVYSAPYAPYYDAYKGHTFKIDHYMEEDTMRKHVWLTGPVHVNGYVDLDDLEEVMPVFATNDLSVNVGLTPIQAPKSTKTIPPAPMRR